MIFDSGKQSVYHALQDSSDGATPEAIAELDQNIKKFQDQLAALKAEDKQTHVELAEFYSRPLLSQLRGDNEQLQKEKDEILAALASLGGDEPTAVSPEEQQAVEKEWKYWYRQSHVSRRICMELWGRCSEVVPENMSREELKVRAVVTGGKKSEANNNHSIGIPGARGALT